MTEMQLLEDLADRVKLILLDVQSKDPVGGVSWSKCQFDYGDSQLLEFLNGGHNYGVVPQKGLGVVDVDDVRLLFHVEDFLPDMCNTYNVESSAHHKRHLYITCEDAPPGKVILYHPMEVDSDGKRVQLGDIRFGGDNKTFTVGPGSISPKNGKVYTPHNMSKGAIDFSYAELMDAFEPFIKKEDPHEHEEGWKKASSYSNMSITDLYDLRIEDVCHPDKPIRNGWTIRGSNPVHGSENGNNLVVLINENRAYCHRCNASMDPAAWVFFEHCGGDEGRSPRTKEDVSAVIKWLEEQGYRKRLPPTFYEIVKVAPKGSLDERRKKYQS